MSSKRRRKRSTSKVASRPPSAVQTETGRADRREEAPRQSRVLAQSPFPPLGLSVSRGLRAVGSSPVLLASAFLSLLATWAVFAALGVDGTPRFLAVAMAIPPAHLFVTDVPVAFAEPEPVRLLAAVAALAVLRSVSFGLLIGLLGDAFRERVDLRSALRRLPRAALTLVAIDLVGVGVVFLLLQVGAGFLGQLTLLLVAAAVYFLAFVPLVAVLEDEPLQGALRRGLRASRLPGTRHLTLVLVYFLFLVYAASISPFGPLAPATPGVLAWAFGLALTFLHVGMLGALAYRWLSVRDQVGKEPSRPGRR